MSLPLADLLPLLLPPEHEARLLRACLSEDAAAVRDYWRLWLADAGDPKRAIAAEHEYKLLLPLLNDSLKRAQADAGDLAPYLRTARLREKRRAQGLAAVLDTLATQFSDGGIEATLIGGMAAAFTAYGDPGLRHCHDIDILVRKRDMPRAVACLSAEGNGPSYRAVAAGGLPVMLHAETLWRSYEPIHLAEMMAARKTVRISAHRWKILAAEDALLQILGSAPLLSGRRRLVWLCDAACLLRSAGPDFDWKCFGRRVADGGVSLQVYAHLSAVRAVDSESVSDADLAAMRDVTAEASRKERDAMVVAIRRAASGSARRLWRYAGLKSRIELLRFAFWPAPGPGQPLFWRLLRLIGFASRGVARRLRRFRLG